MEQRKNLLIKGGFNIEHIIKFKNVSYRSPFLHNKNENSCILKNINLNIKKGEFISVMGANGCGKSTFAKLFNGLIVPTVGDVMVKNKNTHFKNDNYLVKKIVGMVFQNPDSQIITSTVEEEIAFGMENLCFSKEKMNKKIKEVLLQVGLEGYEKKMINFLSGGQKQKLSIASILAMEPEVLVLDEVTSMLDPKSKNEILNIILNLNSQKGVTVILITHDQEEALLAEKTIIMKDGKITAFKEPKKIFSDIVFLKNNNLSPLNSTLLLDFLKNKGYDVDLNSFSIDDCAKEILDLLEKVKK